jgi:hypothetical protein
LQEPAGVALPHTTVEADDQPLKPQVPTIDRVLAMTLDER